MRSTEYENGGDLTSIPTSFWVGTGAFAGLSIALLLPWVTREIAVLGIGTAITTSSNAFQVGVIGLIYLLLLIAVSVLVALRMGYRTFTEILPSGPQREIPNFQRWMTLICIGIVLSPIIAVAQHEGSAGAGVWLAAIAGIVLWLSSLSGYERS